MLAYFRVRSLALVACALLGACGGQRLVPALTQSPAFPSDGALAVTQAPSALFAEPHAIVSPVRLDARAWGYFTADSTQVNLLDENKRTGFALASATFYRLNTRDAKYDYFLLEVSGRENVHDFNGCPYDARRAARYCEYVNGGYAMEMSLAVNGVATGSVIEDSPRGRIDTPTYHVSVGSSLGKEISCEAGWTAGVMMAAAAVAPCKTPLSADATSHFSPETVTGDNLTQLGGSSVAWNADFASIDRPHCKGDFPSESRSSGALWRVAIVRVPREVLYGGQAHPTLTVRDQIHAYNRSIRVAAGSCAGLTTFEHRDSNGYERTYDLPEFQVPAAAHGLRIDSNGTASLATDSHSMYSAFGLAPSMQLQRDGTTIDPKTVGLSFVPDPETANALAPKSRSSFPPHGVWTIVARNAHKGNYVILVDTAPGGQADGLRDGPISVNLTVE
jgi:hypothetical protein